MSKVVTMDQAVAMIKPGSFVITSGFLTAGTPDAIMKAVGESFDATGTPNNLTVMYGAGQGNKKGGQQERWAKEGLIKRWIGGHYGFSPKVIEMILNNQVEAYNLPQGVIIEILNKYQAVKEIGTKQQDDNKLMVYNSPQMSDLVRIMNNVASTDANILIQGESGTGKEVLAEYIHEQSERRGKEMVRINCAAFPETLLESELFGYEKGAFTGALGSGKKGLIETAHESTLFLDEINSLPLALQGKILRTIETKMVQRIGSDRPKKIDFRLIAATNEDLSECIKKKTFRADLYYRLNVIPAIIPPLRERPSDIEPLIEYFLNKYCKKYGRKKSFSPEVMEILKNYSWPGNVRELKNFVERIVLISAASVYTIKNIPPQMLDGQLTLSDGNGGSGMDGCRFDSRLSLEENLNAFEKQIIESVVHRYGSGKSAAEVLKVNQSTISRKMAKYNITLEK